MASRLSESSLLDSGATSFVKQFPFLHPRPPLTMFWSRLSLHGRHDSLIPKDGYVLVCCGLYGTDETQEVNWVTHCI